MVVLFSDWLTPVLAAAGRAAKVVAPCDAVVGRTFQIVTREILIDDYQLATSDEAALEQLMMKGYRLDLLEQERWVYDAKAYLDREATVRDIDIELD